MSEVLERARSYVVRALIGAAMGAALGAGGALRAASETGVPVTDDALVTDASFGAIIGLIAGLIQWRLRALSAGGRRGYYTSFSISVGVATGIVLLPEALATRQWWTYALFVLLGFGGGLGMALFIRQVRGHNW